jgi:hypothetical protein
MHGLAITIIMFVVQIAIQVFFVHALFKYLFDYLLMFGMHVIYVSEGNICCLL